MFSAATMTMRPIVSEIAIFSSAERREQRLVHVGPVLRRRTASPSVAGIDSAISRRGVDVVDAQLDQIDAGPSPSRRLATSSDTKPYVESNSYSPRLKMPATRSRRGPRHQALRRQRHPAASARHRVADVDAELRGEILAEQDAVAARSSAARSARRGCRSCIAPLMSVTSCSSAGSMPLTCIGCVSPARGDQALPENRRRRADARAAPAAASSASAW